MEFEVARCFDSFLVSTFKAESIRNYLLNHERKQVCIGKVCEQIRIAELSNLKGRFDLWRWRQVIEACAGIFANAALNHAEEKALTQAERTRRLDEACRMDNLKAEFDALAEEALSTKLVSRPGAVAN